MSVDPDVIRSEPHHEIGALLENHADEMIEHWCRRAVEEQPHGRRAHHAVLQDHLHEFLRKLGRSLSESRDPYTYQHCLPAATHGVQRWEVGWSLSEVIRDHQILRLVILDFFEENLDRDLRYREILAISLALDEAISASVVAYVNGRDAYLKELEHARGEESREAQRRLEEQAAALKEADRRKNEFLAILRTNCEIRWPRFATPSRCWVCRNRPIRPCSGREKSSSARCITSTAWSTICSMSHGSRSRNSICTKSRCN